MKQIQDMTLNDKSDFGDYIADRLFDAAQVLSLDWSEWDAQISLRSAIYKIARDYFYDVCDSGLLKNKEYIEYLIPHIKSICDKVVKNCEGYTSYHPMKQLCDNIKKLLKYDKFLKKVITEAEIKYLNLIDDI